MSASTPPPEMKRTEDTRNKSCSIHEEKSDLTAGITETSEGKETKNESEMNIRKQTQTYIDKPKTEQKHNKHYSDTENGDDKTEGKNTSFSLKDETQKKPVGCTKNDLKEPSIEQSPSKTEQNELFKANNEFTAENTLKGPSRSSLLPEQNESRESSSKQMTVSGGKPDFIQEHKELRHENTLLAVQKEDSKGESVVEIKNHQLSENGHQTKTTQPVIKGYKHSNISPKTEEDTDYCKDSALDVNVTVSHNEGSFNHFRNGNANSNEDNKKYVLQHSKDEEKMKDVNRNIETTPTATNNSPEETTSVSESKKQKGSITDSKEDEEKQMPPLSDCSGK